MSLRLAMATVQVSVFIYLPPNLITYFVWSRAQCCGQFKSSVKYLGCEKNVDNIYYFYISDR